MSKSRLSKLPEPLQGALRDIRPALIVTAVFSLIINLLLFVGPLYMMQVYDRVLSSRNIGTLVAITLIAVFMLVTFMAIDMFRSRVLVRAGVRFDEMLREKVLQGTLASSLATRSQTSAQHLRDLDNVREFATGAAFITFCDVPFVPIFVAFCFLMHFWLGMVALVGAVVLLALALINERLTQPSLSEAGKSSTAASNFAMTSLRNIEVIYALGMQKAIENRWVKRHLEHLGWQAQASDRAGLVLSVTKMVRQLLQIAILGVGAYLAINRDISPGMMVAASIIMGRALGPVEQAVGQWKAFVAARAAIERLIVLFAGTNAAAERTALPPPEGKISVEALVAGAKGRKAPILYNVAFAVEKGESLAIIGPSGSGKSTLARVLVGVWPISNGVVRFDGYDRQQFAADMLGRHLGYLPQDVELFGGTVAENIARLDPKPDSDKVIEAAKLAGVHAFIQSLPEGYDTQIGEAGNILSGGQRQRIGLARALYLDPPIVVLDEPNSHLDTSGELELAQALGRIKAQGKTLIFISHKPNLLMLADRTLVLNQGSVQAHGKTADVLKALAQAAQQQKGARPEPSVPALAVEPRGTGETTPELQAATGRA